MRVGIIALQHESNTFLSQPTTIESFRSVYLLDGEAVREKFKASHHEVGGFFEGLEAEKVEAVPIFAAWATPGGTITAETCEALLARLLAGLDKAGQLDGLLVAPHGAGVGEVWRDLDGHWLTVLRDRIGPKMPMIGTLDPHANLSPRMVAACNALIAYRSNPHLDQRARGIEAAKLMARTLRGEVQPTMGASFPPVSINIERQLTSASPCTEMYALANDQLTRPGVLTNSVLLGFPYSDVAELGSAFVVVTDNNKVAAQQMADELGQHLWQRREAFRGQLKSIDDAVRHADTSPGPVGLLDMGDNVGGGSPGDSTFLLHALIDAQVSSSLACLYDPESVEQALAVGVGGRVQLSIGGKSDKLHGSPVVAEATVVSTHDGHFTESEARHGGRTDYDQGPTVVVRLAGGQTVILTSRRMPPFSLGQVTSCQLDPRAFRAIVIKGVHAPVAAYSPVCRELVRVDTSGVTCADMTRLPFNNRRRPLFPFENDFEYR